MWDRVASSALADASPYADCDEQALLAAARSGDAVAFEQLWLCNIVAARTFARRVLPTDLREEAVAEAFLACWEAMLKGLGPTRSFRAYLFAAIRNRGKTRLDRRAREQPVDDVDFEEQAEPEAVDSPFDEEALAIISRAFYALAPRDRWALLWSEIDGLSAAEVAGRLDVSVNTAYQIVFRAKAKLRAKYLAFSHDDYMLPVERALAGPPTATDKPTRGKPRTPSRTGRIILAGITGVGVVVGARAGVARAYGGLEGLAEPTGMPTFVGLAATTGTAASVAGGTVATWLGGKLALTAAGVVVAVVAGGVIAAINQPPRAPAELSASVAPAPTLGPVASPSPSATVSTSPPAEPGAAESETPGPTPTPSPTPRPTPSSTPSSTPSQTPVPSEPTSPAPIPPALTIAGIDLGPAGVCYPSLTGTAPPNTHLTVSGLGGATASVVADGSGRWQTARLTGLTPGTSRVTVSDESGVATSATTAVTVASAPSFGASANPGGVSVTVVAARPGLTVIISVDGRDAGEMTLDATGAARTDVVVPLAAGTHTVALRYTCGACDGPALALPVTV